MSRSQDADAYIKKIKEESTPYDKEICGIKLRIIDNVFPTGGIGELFYEALTHPVYGVKKGEFALDYGTGTGYLAIVAAKQGAQVVAIDINQHAVACAQHNIEHNNVKAQIALRQSDGFSALKANEKFDLILAGLPWENAKAKDWLEIAFYDEDFKMRRILFEKAKQYLCPNGRIFFSYAKRVQALAPIESFIAGYKYITIAEKLIHNEPHYIYQITRK